MADLSGPAADTGTSVDEAVPPADGSKERLQYELRQAWAAYDEQRRELERLRAAHGRRSDDVRYAVEYANERDAELERLRVQVVSLTAEHSGACDDLAPCQRCADRDDIDRWRAMEQRARGLLRDGRNTNDHRLSGAALFILGEGEQ